MLHDLVVQLVLHELLEQVLVLLLRLRIGLHFLGALIQVVFYNLLQFVADVHPASGIWLCCLVQPMARVLLTLASALAVAITESAIPDLAAGAIIFAIVANGARRIFRLAS